MEIKQRIENLEKEMKKVKKQKKYFKKFMKFMFCEDKKSLQTDSSQEIDEIKDNHQKEINSLNDKIKFLTNDIIEKENNLKNLNLEKNQLETKLKEKDDEIKSLNKTILELNKNPLKELENLYNSLSDDTKEGIENSFKGSNSLILLASGTKNFDEIWDYTKYLNDENLDDFEIMRNIVEILFDVIKENENYEKQNIELSETFDMEIMIRDNKSLSQSGEVKEIILFGYTKNGKVINKSVVKVGDGSIY